MPQWRVRRTVRFKVSNSLNLSSIFATQSLPAFGFTEPRSVLRFFKKPEVVLGGGGAHEQAMSANARNAMTIPSLSGDILPGRTDQGADHLAGPLSKITESNYEAPAVLDVGTVRDLVKGSSASGSSDANSQYYW
ncbi:lasso RiPP family leader peptide-containing protein [Actinomadura syzygii]|uniref:Lasso RiPP family leader peptide-containing protein n=2 Tax=Actinomadura syzygii TaxID=1427538 RepID=A0A5D0UBW4_9ACTN|nr:lasso RiPP family leader peptide-containing protein [Actinomadura syzygii]